MADKRPELLSTEEVERWADILADELLNSKSLLRRVALEGLGRPDLMRAIAPLVRIPGVEMPLEPTVGPALHELILLGDRDDIRSILKKILTDIPRTTFEWARTRLDPAYLRKFLLSEADKFKGKQGPHLKPSPSRDEELISRADSLYPVLRHVLTEHERGTRHTVDEILDFLLADYDGPVTYIRRHILKIKEVLRNPPKRLNDAKRIETRAKLLSAGLAGCEEYSFNTSVEKVRQARRRSARSSPVLPPREK